MPGKAAKVVVTERQQAVLLELSKSRTEPPMWIQRAKIVLRAFAGRKNQEIAAEVGLNRVQVGTWRRRWQRAWKALTELECSEPKRLREAVREVLRDAPRAGAPGKFTAEQVAQILAVACEPPEKSGRPITHWTRDELRDEVVQRGLVPSISESQVGRFLRQAALQPQRRKMWINTTEKDPIQFQQQVEAVCETYRAAPQRQAEDGTRTVSIDEMTGLQALERTAPDKEARPGAQAKHEFEYARHGTTTLIGNFDVVTGRMFAETIGPTRTEPDVVAHVQRVVATDPEAKWIFVVDNLNVHASASLVEWVAAICEPDRPLGKKRESGRAEIASQPTRIPLGLAPSHSVRIPAQTQFVVESDRGGLWNRDAQGDPSRELLLARRPGAEVEGVSGLLQPPLRSSLPVDLHRQALGQNPLRQVLPTPPPPACSLQSHSGQRTPGMCDQL
jgi:transposase